MASSANQEAQNAAAGHSLASAIQRQQQEQLIKLLAQHFHHQFYQLSGNNNGNLASQSQYKQQQTPQQTVAATAASLLANAYHQPPPSQQAPLAAQMHQQNSYQQGEFALRGFDLSSGGGNSNMNLASMAATNSQLQLHNHILRSQQQQQQQQVNVTSANMIASNVMQTNMANSASIGGQISSGALMDSSVQNSHDNNNNNGGLYGPNDMNLFNALSLNLANHPQLMLSLQQQSLLQATAVARQYESSLRNGVALGCGSVPLALDSMEESDDVGDVSDSRFRHRRKQSNIDQLPSVNNKGNNSDNADVVGHESNNDDILTLNNGQSPCGEGKEMLKFSINTILGRGSPNTAAAASLIGSPFKRGPFDQHYQEAKSFDEQASKNLINHYNNLKNQNNAFRIHQQNNLNESSEHQRVLLAHECDQNESGSDTSTINTSITPILIQQSHQSSASNNTSSSILFANNQRSDNHCANSNNLTDNSTILTQPILRNQQQQPQQQHQQQPSIIHHHNQHPTMQSFLAGSTAFPWTVAARGKPRRGMMRRAVFSDSQRVGLEKRFQLQKYISKPDRKKLAEKLGLRDSQVKIWFQNRRMKWRNSKERELLSAGGSREQTLPTRNNPNPDLSDVGETIKRLAATTATTLMSATTTTTSSVCSPPSSSYK